MRFKQGDKVKTKHSPYIKEATITGYLFDYSNKKSYYVLSNIKFNNNCGFLGYMYENLIDYEENLIKTEQEFSWC